MSMQFFTGIQDFLGLYGGSSTEQQEEEQQETSSSNSLTIMSSSSSVAPPIYVVDLNLTENETSCSVENISEIVNTNSEEPQPQEQLRQLPEILQDLTNGECRESTDADEKIRQCSHDRSVHFPEAIVTHFYDAPTNAFTEKYLHDISAINEAYITACKRLRVEPIQMVQQQIACFHQVPGVRQECLSLKGHRLSFADMECLEEILRKVQFDMLDFEYTFLDDDGAVCLGEMLEFYDSAMKLNLSFNKQISLRGWQAICKAVKDAPSLQYLNLRYTSLSDRAVPVLARTLRSQPSLAVLHLENVSLAGRNLVLVACALKGNTALKELYLGENSLQPADGAHIYQIIITNASIQLLDLRNNQLQDGGLHHICDALKHRDTIKNSALSALVLWNNRITSDGIEVLAQALKENNKLETLNIGCNKLSLEGIVALKPALQQNCSLQRLGLQATNLDCQSAIVLAECLADNKVMVRLDLRDNSQIGSAGLLALHLAMKMNTSITLLNLDTSVANSGSTKVKDYQDQFKVYFEEIKMFCERNKQIALQKLTVQTSVQEDAARNIGKKNGENGKEDKVQEEKVQDTNKERSGRDDLGFSEQSREKSKKTAVWFLNRSSSLTCSETIDDIPERVAQMSRSLSLIKEMPDSLSAVKKSSCEHHFALLGKNELPESLSLPLTKPEDSVTEIAAGTAATGASVTRMSRRLTVSMSNLNATNRCDVARARSRFKVERVGSSIQKTAKTKSDDCVTAPRSLSESCADDSHKAGFLATEDASPRSNGNIKVEQWGKLAGKPTDVLGKNESEPRISETQVAAGAVEKSMPPSNEKGSEDLKSRVALEISEMLRPQDGENICTIPQESVKKKLEDVDPIIAQNFLKGATTVVHASKSNCGSAADLLQSSTEAVLKLKNDALVAGNACTDGIFMENLAKNFTLKQDNKECTGLKSVAVKNSLVILSTEKKSNTEGNMVLMEKSAFVQPFMAEKHGHLVDEVVVQEVIRDLVNYVAYEMDDDDTFYSRRTSSIGTVTEYKDGLLPCAFLSSIPRSTSYTGLNLSIDPEVDKDAVYCVVRGLVRDVLLQEKQSLRRSLRKKRQRLDLILNLDRKQTV